MDPATNRFGDRGEQQIGSDGSLGRNTEQDYEERRHQRAAADAGKADKHADEKADEWVE